MKRTRNPLQQRPVELQVTFPMPERDPDACNAKCPACGSYVAPMDGNYILWSFAALRREWERPGVRACGRCDTTLTWPGKFATNRSGEILH